MSNPAAISGTFADFKLIKTRSAAQIIVEVAIEDADRVLTALGGVPQPGKETHVALARLKTPDEAADEPREFKALKRAQQAGILCNEGAFHRWLDVEMNLGQIKGTDDAAYGVRRLCGVSSRADLDTIPGAGEKWDSLVVEYRNWPGFTS